MQPPKGSSADSVYHSAVIDSGDGDASQQEYPMRKPLLRALVDLLFPAVRQTRGSQSGHVPEWTSESIDGRRVTASGADQRPRQSREYAYLRTLSGTLDLHCGDKGGYQSELQSAYSTVAAQELGFEDESLGEGYMDGECCG